VKPDPALTKKLLDEATVLSDFDSDMDFIVEEKGLRGSTMTKDAFAYLWSGARATKGVCKGKYFFTVEVLQDIPVDHMTDTDAKNRNICRVGWSSLRTELHRLGETNDSFGFGGTGKASYNEKFITYGEPYGPRDVVGCFIDLDSNPKTVAFSKNGRFYNKAFDIPSHLVAPGLFPHVLLKNVTVRVNFNPPVQAGFPPGYQPLDKAVKEHYVLGPLPPATLAECEVLMLIGLPQCGKTTWVEKKVEDTLDTKRYTVLGTDLAIDKMK